MPGKTLNLLMQEVEKYKNKFGEDFPASNYMNPLDVSEEYLKTVYPTIRDDIEIAISTNTKIKSDFNPDVIY